MAHIPPLLYCCQEPPIILTDLLRLSKRPRALSVNTPKIFLHVSDVSLEVHPDQIRIYAHVFRGLGQERSLWRYASGS